jgi:hypothetical protein
MQNTKGLTYTIEGTDYEYYFRSLHEINADVASLVETNTAWQHYYLRNELLRRARQIRDTKINFSYPTASIDPAGQKETFQAGGTVTAVMGAFTYTVFGDEVNDPTGLGRWSGCTLRGKHCQMLTILTAYRTCATTISSAPLGSAFSREYDYLRGQGHKNPHPRRELLLDLRKQIINLRQQGHSVILNMDANSCIPADRSLGELLHETGLIDLHLSHPAPSTYIGSATRRIDYMFGCTRVQASYQRSGTLSYLSGPQADHRGLFVDLDPLILFGVPRISLPPISPQNRRLLKSANPEHVAAYNTRMLEYYLQHNMINRIDNLHSRYKTMSLGAVRKALENGTEIRDVQCAKPNRNSGTLRHNTHGPLHFAMQEYYNTTGVYVSANSYTTRTTQ